MVALRKEISILSRSVENMPNYPTLSVFTERITELDILRLIALFAVILVHLNSVIVNAGAVPKLSVISFVIIQLSTFAVPFFLIISGFSITYLSKYSEMSPLRIFLKQVRKLLPAYILVTLILDCKFLQGSITISSFIETLIKGTAAHHHYVPLIFHYYFLWLFLVKAIERNVPERNIFVILALVFSGILGRWIKKLRGFPSMGENYTNALFHALFPARIFNGS
jgi:surface polysaccharide O-acyltransferase-like enzyme